MVEDDPRLQVVAEASTLSSFRKKLRGERPEVALLDWSMASHDLELTTALLQSDHHSPSIIFLTVSENCRQKQEMLRLGASAFVSKWCSGRKLRSAVWTACTERIPPETQPAESSLAGSGPAPSSHRYGGAHREAYSQRTSDFIPMVCSGLRNKEIAVQVGHRRIHVVASHDRHLYQASGGGSPGTRCLGLLSRPGFPGQTIPPSAHLRSRGTLLIAYASPPAITA